LEAVVFVVAFVLIGRLDVSASLAVTEEKAEPSALQPGAASAAISSD